MGNLLCVPKSSAGKDSKKSKKTSSFKRCFSRSKNKTPNKAIVTDAAATSDAREQDEIQQDDRGHVVQSDTHAIAAVHHEVVVVPLVSSSILLRHFDDESDSDSEVSKETDDVPDVDEGTDSGTESLPDTKTTEDVETPAEERDVTHSEVTKETETDPVVAGETGTSTEESLPEIKTTKDVMAPAKEKDVASVLASQSVKHINGDIVTSLNNTTVEKELKAIEKRTDGKDKSPIVLAKLIQVKPAQSCDKDASNDDVVVSEKEVRNGQGAHTSPGISKIEVSSKDVEASKCELINASSDAGKSDVLRVTKVKPATTNIPAVCYKQSPLQDNNVVQPVDQVLRVKPSISHEVKCINIMKAELNKESPDKPRLYTDAMASTSRKEVEKKEAVSLRATVSCPAVPKKPNKPTSMLELTKMLGALSALKASARSDTPSVKSTGLSRNEFAPQPGTSTSYCGAPPATSTSYCAGPGYYKARDGIQNWLKNSESEPVNSVKSGISGGIISNDSCLPKKVVSDFDIPKRAPRKPPQPLVLKKPSPHLFSIPGIAKSDVTESGNITWTQKEVKGPKTEVLWSTKPTSYDVIFPPLPKRLLAREGSIDKLRNSWVIPQVKQIETLKREYARFPGLKVPKPLRDKYSVDIKIPPRSGWNPDGDDDDDDGDDDDSLDRAVKDGDKANN